MKKTAIIYWPKGGSTEKCAQLIFDKIGSDNCDIYILSDIDEEILMKYDLLIFGGSTVGADNWQDAHAGDKWGPFHTALKEKHISLKGKKVAFFGLGDQILYPDDFVNDMKILHDYFTDLGATPVGRWPQENYEHTDSNATVGTDFIGLALDEHNQPELTNERISEWIDILMKEIQ